MYKSRDRRHCHAWVGDCDEDAQRLWLGTNTPLMISATGTLLEQFDA